MPELFGTLDPQLRDRLFGTVLVLAAIIAVRVLVLRVVRARVEDIALRYRWRKWSTYVAVLLGVLLVGRQWSTAIGEFGTLLGLVTAGLAIALREPVTNLAGWLFIIWRRPFRVGDRIAIGPHAGDVVDVRPFQFSLFEIGNWVAADQSTGRIIHIPNARVFADPQVVYTGAFPYIWEELPVVVTFESDWAKAKGGFRDIVRRHATPSEAVRRSVRSSYAIERLDAEPTVITSVVDIGVALTLRYVVPVYERRAVAERIWEDVLRLVGGWDDVDFAYPTTRFYDNVREGKPAARATPPATAAPPAAASAAPSAAPQAPGP